HCQVAEAGSYRICAKPLAALAVIDPVLPVVRSWTITVRPADPSWISRASLSPEFMNRSVAGSGGKDAVVKSSGPGGACGVPLFVMKAKFAGSRPTVFRQSALFTAPEFWFWLRLKIAIAAHHLLASQLTPAGQGAQPGG